MSSNKKQQEATISKKMIVNHNEQQWVTMSRNEQE